MSESNQGVQMTDVITRYELPVLEGAAVGDHFEVWCRYCETSHDHGEGVIAPGLVRCPTPYKDTGYFVINEAEAWGVRMLLPPEGPGQHLAIVVTEDSEMTTQPAQKQGEAVNESTIIRLDLYNDNCPVPCYICGQKIRPDEEGTRAYAPDHINLVCLECIESGVGAIKARLLERAEEGERRATALAHDSYFADEVSDLTARAAADRANAAAEWVFPT